MYIKKKQLHMFEWKKERIVNLITMKLQLQNMKKIEKDHSASTITLYKRCMNVRRTFRSRWYWRCVDVFLWTRRNVVTTLGLTLEYDVITTLLQRYYNVRPTFNQRCVNVFLWTRRNVVTMLGLTLEYDVITTFVPR
jgi:hypothetical protein